MRRGIWNEPSAPVLSASPHFLTHLSVQLYRGTWKHSHLFSINHSFLCGQEQWTVVNVNCSLLEKVSQLHVIVRTKHLIMINRKLNQKVANSSWRCWMGHGERASPKLTKFCLFLSHHTVIQCSIRTGLLAFLRDRKRILNIFPLFFISCSRYA